MLTLNQVWLAVVASFLVVPVEYVRSQHPSCRHIVTGGLLDCSLGGYILPTNFNTADIELALVIFGIRIAGDGNVGLEHLEPLPHLPWLQKVELLNFNEKTANAFPMSRFLTYNKPTLVSLELINVKLIRLTAADFNGFELLRQLWIQAGSLMSIAVDTFSGLGGLPNFNSRLEYLNISLNPDLTGLDWSFLAPVSRHLQMCLLSGNGLQTDKLIKTRNFRLNSATRILLQDNDLTSVPLSVLETFPEDLQWPFSGSFTGNPLCPNNPPNDCSCCELVEFADWASTQDQRYASSVTFNCGMTSSAPSQIFSLSLFQNTDLHKYCKIPDTTLEPITVPTGTPTKAPEPPVDPAPCKAVIQPVKSICSNGVLTKPSVRLDHLATRFELVSDASRGCSHIAYDLQVWLLEKANLPIPIRRTTNRALLVNCRDDGYLSLTMSDLNPDAVEFSQIVMEAGNTWQCLEIYLDFIKHVSVG